MLITRECDYAIRIIRALSSGEIISIQNICEEEKITTAIAYKISRKLEKSGILKSYRGNAGGYALNCNLHKISLYDILTVIDPKLLLIECMQAGYDCSLNTPQKPCLVHNEFCRIQNKLNEDLKKRSLASVLNL